MSAVATLDWFSRPAAAASQPAMLNVAYNALDRHVIRGRGEGVALVVRGGGAPRRAYDYAELLERSAQLAGGLWQLRVHTGDAVVIWLPDIAERVITMLACARIGVVPTVLPLGLGARELADAVAASAPALVVTASAVTTADGVRSLPLELDEALAPTPYRATGRLVLQRPQVTAELVADRDVDFALLMRPGAFEPGVAVELAGTDPLLRLVAPAAPAKAPAVLPQAGFAMAVLDWLHDLGIDRDDVVATLAGAEDVVAQACGVYGPLLLGAGAVLTDAGAAPTDLAALQEVWRSVAAEAVTVLVVSPAFARAAACLDPGGEAAARHDLSRLRRVVLVGDGEGEGAGEPPSTGWVGRTGATIVHTRVPHDLAAT